MVPYSLPKSDDVPKGCAGPVAKQSFEHQDYGTTAEGQAWAAQMFFTMGNTLAARNGESRTA